MTSEPLAEVKVSKLKDCPMLTAGKITPQVLQNRSAACRRYMKHANKSEDDVTKFVADAMLEPRLMAWYQGEQMAIVREGHEDVGETKWVDPNGRIPSACSVK